MNGNRLEELIDAQQRLADKTGLQSSLSADRAELKLPDGAGIYYSERRGHFVLSSNYNGRYDTVRAAIDDWLFYLSCKLNPGKDAS